MARKLIVQPPIGGIQRQLGFQSTPPYASIESVNFWPRDAVTGRAVSATRPPLDNIDSPGAGVNLLVRVNGDATQTPQISMVSAYAGNLYWWDGDSWQAATMGSVAVPTSRAVYAATFLKRVFIMDDTLAPIVFNYADKTVTQAVATAGTFPVDCRVAATWQGALWVAGAAAQPQVFSASRTGDPFDWDFTDEDTGAAFTATGENSGLLSEAITALIPHTSATMVIASENSMSVMRGHPLRGGSFESISSTVGVLGQGAWALGPNDDLYFLSKAGLCVLKAGAANPTIVSQKKIPDDLLGLTHTLLDPKVSMAYDSRWNGIHIAVRGDEQQAWWYDLESGGFHQMTFSGYPHVMLSFSPLEGEAVSGVLYGGEGYGGVARFDTTGSEYITSWLLTGPVKISPGSLDKSIIEQARHYLSGQTSDSTGSTIRMWCGVTPEDAYNKYLAGTRVNMFEATIPTLLRNGGKCSPRVGGGAMMIEIFCEGIGRSVSYEGTELELEAAGQNHFINSRVGADFDPAFIISPPTGTAGGPTTRQPYTLDPLDPSYRFYSQYWSSVATASASALDEDTEDMPLLIDLSNLPGAWWLAVADDGSDIRPTTSNNRQLPFDLLAFDKDAETGLLVVRQMDYMTDLSNGTVKLYAGNPYVGSPSVESAIGQYAAYEDDLAIFSPSGGAENRTSWDFTITENGALGPPTVVAGLFELDASQYATVQSTGNGNEVTFTGTRKINTPSGSTMIAMLKHDSSLATAGANEYRISHAISSMGINPAFGVARAAGPGTPFFFASYDASGASLTANNSAQISSPSFSSFTHIAMTTPDSVDTDPLSLYVNGALNDVTNQDSTTIANTMTNLVLGQGLATTGDGGTITRTLALVYLYSGIKDADFIDAHYDMINNNATFWGSWV